MMRINPRKKKKSIYPLVLLSIVLVFIAGYLVLAKITDRWPFSGNTPTDSRVDTNSGNQSDDTDNPSAPDKDKAPDDQSTVNKSNPDDHTPKQYETPSDNPKSNSLTGVITSQSVTDGTLRIRTTINQFVSNGTCTITLKRTSDGKTFTQTAGIATEPSTSSCKGFDITTAKLGSGEWSIDIKINSGDLQGTLTSKVSI